MTKKPTRVPQPKHQSLKALPKLKGGYYRRIKDIERALERPELGFDKLSPVGQFLFLFFGCEKLGLAIMGLDARYACEDAYGKGKFVLLPELKAATTAMKLSIRAPDIEAIFGNSKTSARELRHSLVHDLGPSNIKNVGSHCARNIPAMKKFIACIEEVHDFQRKNF
jgi:hypothetical protein